jgi:hypothetical protein
VEVALRVDLAVLAEVLVGQLGELPERDQVVVYVDKLSAITQNRPVAIRSKPATGLGLLIPSL